MQTSNPEKPVRVHLIGIAGEGMAGLAMCLHDKHYIVTGSDPKKIRRANPLLQLKILIFSDHAASNVHQSEYVIYSDAIDSSHVELAEARLLNIPTLSRVQAITQLLAPSESILVAGSHGKSTTCAMIATMLVQMGEDPSYLIGAEAASLKHKRGHMGNGALFVGEACEAYENLAYFEPTVAVITNLDDEHIEHYGSQSRLDRAFILFANRAKKGVAINLDDPGVCRIVHQIHNQVISFGIDKESDITAKIIRIDPSSSSFDLYIQGNFIQKISIPLPGVHIVQNALAAIASLVLANIAIHRASVSLSQYQGATRRWQSYPTGEHLCVIDDYAHHPTEIRAIRLAARAMMQPSERLVIAFQPQLFSRTKRKAKEFAQELASFDEIWLLEIDGAHEPNKENITSEIIHTQLRQMSVSAHAVAGPVELIKRLVRALKKNDVLLIVGAGSICDCAKQIADYFSHHPDRLGLSNGTPLTAPDHGHKFSEPSEPFTLPINSSYPGVLRFFYRQISQQPHALALVTPTQSMTYRELNHAANRIATLLQLKGVGKADVVAVQISISVELIALLIALQKLGAIYLPLDTQLPPKRGIYQMEVSNTKLWITQDNQPAQLSTNFILHLDISQLTLQLTQANVQNEFLKEISVEVGENECAYICFTSGSTGKPKGVLIGHQALANFVNYGVQRFEIDCKSKFIANTSIGFDVSLGEIWMALCSGAQLAIPEQESPLMGTALTQFIKNHRITHLAITPSLLATMPNEELPELLCIISAGESPKPELINYWGKNRSFFNAYGPTEATIYASVAYCEPHTPIRIGNPIDHVELRLIDSEARPFKGPGIGELCIGGIGLMQHYLAANKNEGFIEIALGSNALKKYYRTGDLMERHADGSLEYLRRCDSQIKINGIRIELTEIESILLQHPTVADAVVCFDQSNTNSLLIGFVVLKSQNNTDWPALKKKLSDWLPNAMVPHRLIEVKSIPLTLTGKKDRELLLSNFRRKKLTKKNYSAPRNAIEIQLADLWKTILRSEFAVSVTEEFQWLGGDSIQYLELISQIEDLFQIEIPPGYLGFHITIESLAIKVAELRWEHNRPDPANTNYGFKSSRVYKGLRDLTALWPGRRINSSSIIVSHGKLTANNDIFLCVQNESEYKNITLALGDAFRVHAMRSGHLLMDYTPQAINNLAKHYSTEFKSIAPTGKIIIGGICQGASIATEMAKILINDGYQIQLLILIDQARLSMYPGKIAFIYSSMGPLNPYSRFENALSRFDAIYGKNYSLELVSCEHGAIHLQPHVNQLVQIIFKLIPKENSLNHITSKEMRNITVNHTNQTAQIPKQKSLKNAYQIWFQEKKCFSDIELIKRSALFDLEYYLAQLSPCANTPHAEAIQHFANFGWQHDLDPSCLFSTIDYQKKYPEVVSEGINPLVHFLRKGMYQGKIAWPDANLLTWQGAMHCEPELAMKIIADCPLPWLKLNNSHVVYLYAHSHGHFAFRQFQELLSQGLTAVGITNYMVNENSLVHHDKHAIALIIGAHEFFFLKGAKDPLEFNLENLIIFNSEQLNSYWFARIFPILEKTRYVIDINLQTAASLVKLGINARYLPLGHLQHNTLFTHCQPKNSEYQYRLDVASEHNDGSSKSYSYKRDIDVLWVGSNSQRRNQFWQNHKAFFDSINAITRLISARGPLNAFHPNAVMPDTFLKLSHRSKIVLNVHHFETPYFEWQRLMHYGLMQGACVVTEPCSRVPGIIPGVHYFEEQLNQLPGLINWLLHDPQGQKQLEKVRKAGYQAAITNFQLCDSLRQLFALNQNIKAKNDLPIKSQFI